MGDQYDEWNEKNLQGKDEEGREEIGKQNVSRSDNMNVKSMTFLKRHPASASSVLHDNLQYHQTPEPILSPQENNFQTEMWKAISLLKDQIKSQSNMLANLMNFSLSSDHRNTLPTYNQREKEFSLINQRIQPIPSANNQKMDKMFRGSSRRSR